MDLIAEIHAALGKEGLAKARWQERMRVALALLNLVFLLAYVGLWMLTPLGTAAKRIAGGHPWPYALIFFFGQTLFTLPLAYLQRWVELRLGTTRQGFWGWVGDWAKQSAVNLALMTLLFGSVFVVLVRWPQTAIWGFLLLTVAFAALLHALGPFLVRLEHRTEPVRDPELAARIKAVFDRAGVPFRGVYLARAGEKTKRSNAMVVPKAGGYQVVVYDTLVEALDPEGLAFVVAHELGHIKHRHTRRSLVLFSGLLFLSLILGDALMGAPALEDFPLFYLGTMLAFFLGSLLMNAVARRWEFAADRFAFDLTGDLEAFKRSFLALARDNLSDPEPPAWIEALLHDHPSIARRVQALKRHAGGGTGG